MNIQSYVNYFTHHLLCSTTYQSHFLEQIILPYGNTIFSIVMSTGRLGQTWSEQAPWQTEHVNQISAWVVAQLGVGGHVGVPPSSASSP